MKIDIASRDERYKYLCTLLNNSGHTARIVNGEEIEFPDALILPIKREHTDDELYAISKRIYKDAKVFYGGDEFVRQSFRAEFVDYSKNEYFLLDNARITAEAFFTVWQREAKESLLGKKILISGYGRLGKYLAKMLSSFGAKIYVFARRDEVKLQAQNDGFFSVDLAESTMVDAVINTVPSVIFNCDLLSKIPKDTYLFELASKTGFEETEGVVFALGLPGKILPKSAAEAIYNAVISYLD